MHREGILQHVIETVFHVDDKGICIEFPHIPLHKQPPLFFGINDMAHPRLTEQELFLHHPLGFHLGHFMIDARPIAEMLLRRIEHLLRSRHFLCQDARQETQPALGRLVPIRHGASRLSAFCFLTGLILTADFFVRHIQRFQEVRTEFEVIANFGVDHHIGDDDVLIVEIVRHKVLCRLQILQRVPGYGNFCQNVHQSVRIQGLKA